MPPAKILLYYAFKGNIFIENTKEKLSTKTILLIAAFFLLGAVIYGILYYIGYVAYLGTYAIFALAIYAYKKYGNVQKLEKKDYVIFSLISVAVSLLTIAVCLTIYICVEYNVTFSQSINFWSVLLKSEEFLTELLSDILWGVVFIAVAAFSTYFIDKRKQKQEQAEQAKKFEIIDQPEQKAETQNTEPSTTEESQETQEVQEENKELSEDK